MKKLIVLALVLSMATMASAALKISVNGDIDVPDTTIILGPSQTVELDIWGDGATPATDPYLIVEGPGTVTGMHLIYAGSLASAILYEGAGEPHIASLNTNMGFSTVQAYYYVFADAVEPFDPLEGVLANGMILHCNAPGDVKLTLGTVGGYEDDNGDWQYVFNTMDTQIIHQIPEPITIGLLGLGGLFLRRRSK